MPPSGLVPQTGLWTFLPFLCFPSSRVITCFRCMLLNISVVDCSGHALSNLIIEDFCWQLSGFPQWLTVRGQSHCFVKKVGLLFTVFCS